MNKEHADTLKRIRDLEKLAMVPMKEAIPLIMDKYHVPESLARQFWIRNRPHNELREIGSLSYNEAVPLIMEKYDLAEDEAQRLWIDYSPPTEFEDFIQVSPEEHARLLAEAEASPYPKIRFGGKKGQKENNKDE